MSIILSANSDFKPCPEGDHNAVCVDIIELPNVKTSWKGKEKIQDMVRLVWETDCEMEGTGKPFLVFNRYFKSIGIKSNLRKHLKSWRGRDFTDDELTSFDIEQVIGAPCRLVIEHSKSKTSDQVYANISAILRAKEGQKLKPTGNYIRMKDRPAKDGEAPKATQATKEELEKDDIPF